MEVNYVVDGDGETIVLIHGLSDNLIYWEPLIGVLKNNFKVIRFDLRGHGQSQLGNDEITIDLYAEDLKTILDELNVSKVNLVGFSLGGCIALDFAIKYPSNVFSVVLMSSFARPSEHGIEILNQFLETLEIGFGEFYDYILPKVLCPKVIENNKEELDMIKSMAAPVANVDAFKKAIHALLKFDVWEKLEDIEIPMMVLAGKYDEISLVSEQIELSNYLKNSELIVFDDVKHNLLVGGNIVNVGDVLTDFLKKKKKK